MPVVPAPARHTIKDIGDELILSIPSRKYWFYIFFDGFWLIVWAFGEISTLSWVFDDITFLVGLFSGKFFSGPGLFMVAWLVMWTMAGAYTIYVLLWQLFGKEVLEITSQAITIRKVVLGFDLPKEYSAAHIKDLRVAKAASNPRMFGFSLRGIPYSSDGLIAFDYGYRTYKFGSSVDEAEAKQVVQEILQRFPQYQSG